MCVLLPIRFAPSCNLCLRDWLIPQANWLAQLTSVAEMRPLAQHPRFSKMDASVSGRQSRSGRASLKASEGAAAVLTLRAGGKYDAMIEEEKEETCPIGEPLERCAITEDGREAGTGGVAGR